MHVSFFYDILSHHDHFKAPLESYMLLDERKYFEYISHIFLTLGCFTLSRKSVKNCVKMFKFAQVMIFSLIIEHYNDYNLT